MASLTATDKRERERESEKRRKRELKNVMDVYKTIHISINVNRFIYEVIFELSREITFS